MVFFDKFCPDLHHPRDLLDVGDGATSSGAIATSTTGDTGGITTSGTSTGFTSECDQGAAAAAAAYGAPAVAAAVLATTVANASISGTGDTDHASPVHGASSSSSSSTSSFSSLVAACKWCGVELGNSSVTILSDDSDSGDGIGNADEEVFLGDGQAVGGAGMLEGGHGDGGVPVLSWHGFVRRFVDGSGTEDLTRRGDLLRKVHVANKVWHAVVLFRSTTCSRVLICGTCFLLAQTYECSRYVSMLHTPGILAVLLRVFIINTMSVSCMGSTNGQNIGSTDSISSAESQSTDSICPNYASIGSISNADPQHTAITDCIHPNLQTRRAPEVSAVSSRSLFVHCGTVVWFGSTCMFRVSEAVVVPYRRESGFPGVSWPPSRYYTTLGSLIPIRCMYAIVATQ